MHSSGSKDIEFLVRGVWSAQDRILLCHQKGAKNTFLPGGHIEFCERAEKALVREIREELGLECLVGDFLGAVEHSWQDHSNHHEINLIFLVSGADPGQSPKSRESHLEFLWHSAGDLAAVGLEPYVLADLLPRWLNGKSASGWGSTIS